MDWIDITHLAIGLIEKRLSEAHGDAIKGAYETIGEPTSVDAAALAGSDPYQFQWWALSLVGARPAEQKKGKDRGIDGRIYFNDDMSGDTKSVILSVKAGHAPPEHVRDLRGTVEREKANNRRSDHNGEANDRNAVRSRQGRVLLVRVGIPPEDSTADGGGSADKKRNQPGPDRQTGTTFKKVPKAKGQIQKGGRLGFDD